MIWKHVEYYCLRMYPSYACTYLVVGKKPLFSQKNSNEERLVDASKNGDKEAVVSLLDLGMDPNLKDNVNF